MSMAPSNDKPRFIDFAELEVWFERVRRPSCPVMEAERRFENLVWSDDVEAPRLTSYDDLASAARRGRLWMEVNPCPDDTIGLQFLGQMAAYGDVATTVRSAVTIHVGGTVMVHRLAALRDEIDLYAEAIDKMEP